MTIRERFRAVVERAMAKLDEEAERASGKVLDRTWQPKEGAGIGAWPRGKLGGHGVEHRKGQWQRGRGRPR